MLRSLKLQRTIARVGLDIGTHSIKGVEVVEKGSDLVIRSAGAVQIPGIKAKGQAADPSLLIQSIKNLWSSAGFSSRRVILGLPSDAVYIKWLHIESTSDEELGQIARAAATRGAPFPAHDAIVDYRVLSSRGTTNRNVHFVMLIAASSAVIDWFLNLADSSGLEPLAVDLGSAATLRSFQMQKAAASPVWSGQPLAHCVIGAKSTTIMVARGSELEFARTVPVGGDDFTECISDYTGLTFEQADKLKKTATSRLIEGGTLLAINNNDELRIPCENVVGRLGREIQRSLRFFRSQFAEGSYLGMMSPATLSGGGSQLNGLEACLQEQGIEVAVVINPFAGFSVDSSIGGLQHIVGDAASYTTAVGLAVGDYWNTQTVTVDTKEIVAA